MPTQRRRIDGVVLHRSQLRDDEWTVLDGIPVTTVARTLLDLAAVLKPRPLENALNEAEVRRLGDLVGLRTLLVRHRGRAGTTVLTELVSAMHGADEVASPLEHRFRTFLQDHALPRPRFNEPLRICGREVRPDCAWRPQRLVAELDGRAVHTTRRAFEEDRARDRLLLTAGWRVVRITDGQLRTDPAGLAADLRLLLGVRA